MEWRRERKSVWTELELGMHYSLYHLTQRDVSIRLVHISSSSFSRQEYVALEIA